MSKKETQSTETKQEKVMTSYDRKMQKKEELKKQEKKDKHKSTIIMVAIAAAVVCLIASFPIRNYLALHEAYITIGGEDITKVEFDYQYNLVKNNYINQYSAYMPYFGVDPNVDLAAQQYSDTMTWKDYFEQMAVDNLIRSRALIRQAKAEGFQADVTEEYANYEENVKRAAKEAEKDVKTYVKEQYGPQATLGRIRTFVEESIYANKFFEQIAEQKMPSAEEIQTYYDENKDDYDVVDYRMTSFAAELPDEPTEEETKAAMAEAKEKADEAVKTVAADGELRENVLKMSTVSAIRDWLFDSSRKEGDTAVIEDTSLNICYALAFEKRYLNETLSNDVRLLITKENGEALLDEWKAGEATEDTFAALCKENSLDVVSAQNGGLYEELFAQDMPAELGAWVTDDTRAAGDTVAITTEDGYNYVLYYVGKNIARWQLEIRETLLSADMNAYVSGISEGIEVEDAKGKLNYLKLQALEKATANTAE